MHLVIVAFDLKESGVDFPELRAWVRDRAAADYAALPGMRFKAWFSDERKRLWGAVYLVDSADAFDPERLPRLPDGRTGPVGTRPTSITWFDLEAFVAGPDGLDGLDELRAAGLSLRAERTGA
ncbi:hypothetical protein GCM10022243_30310 [Saccharothrix violaceirubra]|uniref:Uncharacterized protein n=1 Tax=Saccharothrix violaceirubra TaxID=413306 RepID=A0A7W7T5I0_9PSEU|nr:hypothetical protein [Saccharothrix violaceirubra]MBB4966656.1 hypothetical protein [Saccharothrix violaceirubra]